MRNVRPVGGKEAGVSRGWGGQDLKTEGKGMEGKRGLRRDGVCSRLIATTTKTTDREARGALTFLVQR